MIATWGPKKYARAKGILHNLTWTHIGFVGYTQAVNRYAVYSLEYALDKALKRQKRPHGRNRTVEFFKRKREFMPQKYCVKCRKVLHYTPIMCKNEECVRFGLLTFVYEDEGVDDERGE